MVRIYLVQHGQSKSKEEDPERRLTEKGISETKSIGEILLKMGIRVNKVYHSGKARAQMTAEILSKYIGNPEIMKADGLNPLDEPNQWYTKLSKIDEDIMIVGHLPHLSKLASMLLSVHNKEIVKFSYSGVLCLEKNDEWKIVWFIKPENLAKD